VSLNMPPSLNHFTNLMFQGGGRGRGGDRGGRGGGRGGPRGGPRTGGITSFAGRKTTFD
jgi:nucleolin